MHRFLFVGLVLVLGCDGTVKVAGDGETDTGTDGHDTVADTEADPGIDTEADPGADTEADPGTDTAADPGTDTAVDPGTDTFEDTTEDVPTDAGCGDAGDCMAGLLCCDGRCANPMHDPDHCGGCGSLCSETLPYCDMGVCGTRPCFSSDGCPSGEVCCGFECCSAGEICCMVDGPGPTGGPGCYVDVCPGGCPLCA